ncbi:MAG: hypothetical protein ABI367_02555 [Mucilaginibacter sp.]
MDDLKLKNDQILNAILLLTIQNNIQIRALTTTLLEIIPETSEQVDEAIVILNAQNALFQHEVVAKLKLLYGDVDDIDINDILKGL